MKRLVLTTFVVAPLVCVACAGAVTIATFAMLVDALTEASSHPASRSARARRPRTGEPPLDTCTNSLDL